MPKINLECLDIQKEFQTDYTGLSILKCEYENKTYQKTYETKSSFEKSHTIQIFKM